MNAIVFNTVKAFFQENIIAIFLGLTLLSSVVTIVVTRWVTKVNERQSSLSTGIEKLEKTITSFMEEIRDDVKAIFRLMPSPTTESRSPIQLTSLGKTIAEEIHAEKWVPERAQALKKEVRTFNAYDIQERCFDYAQRELMRALSVTQADELKLSAYRNGLEISAVLEVAGVLLRDKVLELLGGDMGAL